VLRDTVTMAQKVNIFNFIHHITSKNTTNEIEKMTTVPLYPYKLLNSQNQLQIGLLNHLTQQVRMVFIFNIEFFSTFLKKYTGPWLN